MSSLGYGSLATLIGRYYAMDRDKRFERNKLAFEGMTQGIGECVSPDQVISVSGEVVINRAILTSISFHSLSSGWR